MVRQLLNRTFYVNNKTRAKIWSRLTPKKNGEMSHFSRVLSQTRRTPENAPLLTKRMVQFSYRKISPIGPTFRTKFLHPRVYLSCLCWLFLRHWCSWRRTCVLLKRSVAWSGTRHTGLIRYGICIRSNVAKGVILFHLDTAWIEPLSKINLFLMSKMGKLSVSFDLLSLTVDREDGMRPVLVSVLFSDMRKSDLLWSIREWSRELPRANHTRASLASLGGPSGFGL